MSEYIDLVICKHGNNPNAFIFQAPEWSALKTGDKVIVENKKGESEATVERVYTVNTKDREEFEFIMMASGATLPLKKVLKKVTYRDFKYENEGSADEKIRPSSKA